MNQRLLPVMNFAKRRDESAFSIGTCREEGVLPRWGSFFYWMAGASGDVCPFFAGGHALGAAFNQFVRRRAQLLLLE